MNRSVFYKLLISFFVVGWALWNVFPIETTPFDTFLTEKVSAKEKDFDSLLKKAEAQVAEGKAGSVFIALTEIGKKDKIDFAQFFPQYDLSDVKNLEKRNEILLRHLLQASQGKIKLGLDLQGGVAFTLKVDENALSDKDSFYRRQQLNKAIDIMERRVNGLGVAEPLIRARGNDEIEVQLPGISTQENPDALQNLQKPAKLSFHKVHRLQYPSSTKAGEEPAGYIPMTLERVDPKTGEVRDSQLYIKRIPEMGGSIIKEAYVSQNQFGGYEILISMTDKGAKRFEEVTRKIVEEGNEPPFNSLPENHPAKKGALAIVLDGKLYSAPRVNDAIPGGRAVIQGDFSQRDALELANVLNNPLEFELKLEEMNEVGPTLADDARTASINAAILGASLVIAFMVAYYLGLGVISVVMVIANIAIVLGVLASLQFTLTLPGVAALVLTVGMAVDANILIYERIREELRLGKKIQAAVLAGFDKAFSTILDANLTTLLTAFILIWLGTGPIKGFGVTLSIGIGATMFCALVLTRALLELIVNKGWLKNPFPFTVFKEKNIDFLKYRRPAFIISWLVVLAGIVGLIVNRNHIYSIDFVGGDEISLKFTEKPSIQDIYHLANEKKLGEVVPSYQTALGSKESAEILKIQTELGQGHKVFDALKASFPKADFVLLGENTIGGSVSDSIKSNALLSLGMAILGILVYVAFRFEMGFGMGAVVSTVHDVLLSVGIYVLIGGQFSAPMVAAVLMIVGYSINDTIVVFDRIREELQTDPTSSLKKIINLSINKTLSRTLLTSLTTFMAALALYIFGAGVINDFALVFMLGIITGTFSSIFIASPVFYWWHKGDRLHVEQKEFVPKYDWESGSK